ISGSAALLAFSDVSAAGWPSFDVSGVFSSFLPSPLPSPLLSLLATTSPEGTLGAGSRSAGREAWAQATDAASGIGRRNRRRSIEWTTPDRTALGAAGWLADHGCPRWGVNPKQGGGSQPGTRRTVRSPQPGAAPAGPLLGSSRIA